MYRRSSASCSCLTATQRLPGALRSAAASRPCSRRSSSSPAASPPSPGGAHHSSPLVVASAVVFAVVVGAIVTASLLMLRSHASTQASSAPGELKIGDNVDLPLLLDGDRLAVSSLDGGTPDTFTPPGTYGDPQFDDQGRTIYIDVTGNEPGFYRVQAGKPQLLVKATFTSRYWSASTASWSPDGRWAAWVDESGTLNIADTTGRIGAELQGVGGFLWSPDSTRVMAWTADGSQAWIVDARTNVATPSAARPPSAWSTEGDVVWLESFDHGLRRHVRARSRGWQRRAHARRCAYPPEGPVPTPRVFAWRTLRRVRDGRRTELAGRPHGLRHRDRRAGRPALPGVRRACARRLRLAARRRLRCANPGGRERRHPGVVFARRLARRVHTPERGLYIHDLHSRNRRRARDTRRAGDRHAPARWADGVVAGRRAARRPAAGVRIEQHLHLRPRHRRPTQPRGRSSLGAAGHACAGRIGTL